MATKTNSTPTPFVRVGLGFLPSDIRLINSLKRRLSKTLDGKITTIRVIRTALNSLDTSIKKS